VGFSGGRQHGLDVFMGGWSRNRVDFSCKRKTEEFTLT